MNEHYLSTRVSEIKKRHETKVQNWREQSYSYRNAVVKSSASGSNDVTSGITITSSDSSRTSTQNQQNSADFSVVCKEYKELADDKRRYVLAVDIQCFQPSGIVEVKGRGNTIILQGKVESRRCDGRLSYNKAYLLPIPCVKRVLRLPGTLKGQVNVTSRSRSTLILDFVVIPFSFRK